jgi:hypothetical protein
LVWLGGFVAWWLFSPLLVMVVVGASYWLVNGRIDVEFDDYLEVAFFWRGFDQEHWYLVAIASFTATLQLMLAVPAVPPYAAASEGRSMRTSIIAAAIVAGALSTSLLFAAGEVIAFLKSGSVDSGWRTVSLGVQTEVVLAAAGFTWLVVSAIWTRVLWRVGSTSSPDVLDRIVRRAFTGSALQVVLGLPLYAIIRRKESCWCALNTFWSICIGLTSMLLLCGPGVVLLLTRADRRAWRGVACGACGHLRAPGEVRCPECGAEHSRAGPPRP